MSDIETIETEALTYANAMNALATEVNALQIAIDDAKRRRLPAIKRLVERAAHSKGRLYKAIAESRALFERPRTQVLHGVKVGYTKAKGKVEIDDEAAVIKRIRRLLPEDQAELLIRTEEHVHKPAVYDLSVDDLKRLGIEVTGSGDQVVIKLLDSDIEKIVDALLKGNDDDGAARP